jgi:hypothetical protein
MKIIISTLLTVTLLTSLIGCQSQYGISNGAYSDISLNRDSKEYSIKRLKEVSVESKALFGIPIDKSVNKKQGLIVRFNGINLTASKRFWPIVSMVGVSLATGMVIQGIAGTKEVDYDNFNYYETGHNVYKSLYIEKNGKRANIRTLRNILS